MTGSPETVKKSSFAQLIGVTPGRVTQMISKGLPVGEDGKINVASGKLWIRDNIDPVRAAAQAPAQGEMPFAATPDAADEKRRLIREQADHVALKNQTLSRELVKASEVERTWTDIVRQSRSKILAVPTRLQQMLPHLSRDDIMVIDRELRLVLKDLADA